MNRAMVAFVGMAMLLGVTAAHAAEKMELISPAFKNNETIPDQYTCHGSNVNPELQIVHLPPAAQSVALTLDDLDAPEGSWVHWVVHDIAPKTSTIPANATIGVEGLSDWGIFRYKGPCPANKRLHRYIFRVYALSERLDLNEGFIKSDLEKKMKGKILDQAELIGTYKNSDNYNE